MRTRLLLLTAALLAGPASAATFIATKTADTNDGVCDADCSLREAVRKAKEAPGFDTILFAPSLAGQTITLALGELRIDETRVRIDGEDLGLTVSGNGASVVFNIVFGTLELANLTITGGRGGRGGGIWCESGLVMDNVTVRGNVSTYAGGGIYFGYDGFGTIRRSTISGNTAVVGGGLYAAAERSVVVEHSTISGNVASSRGGGIYSSEFDWDGSFVSLHNVTLTGNEAGTAGGGLFSSYDYARVDFRNSVLAGNTVGGDVGAPTSDCEYLGASTSYGYSVLGAGTGCISDGPGDVTVAPDEVFARVLSPVLANNGGPTLTYALRYRPDNPALDIGGACGSGDQRGFPAPVDGPDADATAQCDAGSVEAGPVPPAAYAVELTPDQDPVVIPAEGGTFALTFAVTNGGPEAQSVHAWTEATLPDGSTRLALGPVTVTLGPGESATRALVQRVPADAPAGSYTYTGYVGAYPDGGVAGDSFVGTKAPTLGRVLGASAASEWAAFYAGSGAPIVSGSVWAADTVHVSAAMPSVFALHEARPNPFGSQTTLAFGLPQHARVRLAVYDVLGREVAVPANGAFEVGTHEVVLDAARLAPGVYLLRLETGEQMLTRRLTVAR